MRTVITLFRMLFGVIVALAIFEIAFRLLPKPEIKRWSDRPREFYMPESAVTLQDKPYPNQKPADTFRIVVVGDSFTFGPHLQYDDTFSKRLERWFNLNNQAKHVEVINAGVSGYSTHHEVAIVEKAIRKQQADLVLLEVTLNDAELGPLTAKRQKAIYGATYLKNRIFNYWKSAKFVLERLHNSKTRRLYKQYFFDLYQQPATLNVFKEAVKTIADTSKDTKIPVLGVIFPLFSFPMDAAYPFTSIHKTIEDTLAANNIPFLDLLKFYTDIPNERLQVIPVADSHPNEIANRIAAEAIYNWLRSTKAVPSEYFAKHSFAKRKDMRSKSIKRH